MAELTISPDEIRSALDDFVKSYEPSGASRTEVGTVVSSGDGIARVEGLPSAMANELLRFENGTLGIALNLDEREIGVVVLGESEGIDEGSIVHGTGDVLSVPVGDGYLGRVVDAMGNPIDGLGEISGIEGRRALELQAAGVMDRQEVREPLQTGLKAIDAMIPIGRGQRQLIIGDRKTGKTAIAIDTIINQKSNWESGDPTKQVRCIYVAVGAAGDEIQVDRPGLAATQQVFETAHMAEDEPCLGMGVEPGTQRAGHDLVHPPGAANRTLAELGSELARLNLVAERAQQETEDFKAGGDRRRWRGKRARRLSFHSTEHRLAFDHKYGDMSIVKQAPGTQIR